MRSSRYLVLACAALCGSWFSPPHVIAQDALPTRHRFATSQPLTLAWDPPIPNAQPPVKPSRELSLAEAARHDAIGDTFADDPLYLCACGCGVFEVGTSSMFPHGQGGMVWVEWDYQDQNRNRHGSSAAPSAQNGDKELRTEFYNLGLQYFFDRRWGLQVEVPVDHRHFATADGTTDWTALGDIRLKGLYTGFSEDQSIGVDFGVKVPTGNFSHNGADRDTQIGSGSTDLLLGAFYRTNLTADRNWNFFAQAEGSLPVLTQDRYRPGFEIDAATGVYYGGFSFHGVKIVPVGQVIGSYRGSDGGDNSAHPVASGYQRVLLSPGIEFDMHPFTVYADIEIPVYQYFRGDQLAAPALFKVIVTYGF